MSYLETYFSRINHMGNTTAERIKNGGIRSFQKWMDESPQTVINLSVEAGLFFSGILETSKDKAYEKILFLHVANDIPLQVGDMMNWPQDDGTTEKWLLFQKTQKVNAAYQTFWITKCKYLVRWVNKEGHQNQSWAYVVSSVDDKIKGNYRTWNNLNKIGNITCKSYIKAVELLGVLNASYTTA